ncbi:hypothetical protein JT739_03320 [Tepidanaerobacter sp. GT38]|uniref:Gmad2 immunoglobulin-like domain-containing protein n=1 Tax=Tepidanaerobacter sp. GT38 TaxID=2722793 RepID=UPI001F35099C|nr:Gmad2 immunoglobulin-like domain-containing protein [Tepidanaerobacter sp. GT38]MCG1011623.1 hypothetical protein [Tepidanaerobacter sp. GT38]
MKRLSLIIFCLVIIALLSAGCFTKAADETPAEIDQTTRENLNESEANPSNNGTDENQEPVAEYPDTPVASDVNFIIDEPSEGQSVKSGSKLTIKGKTRVKEFNIEVEDGHEILGTAHVSVSVKSQELEEFEATVELSEHTSPSGMIIFVTEDENGQRQEELMLPINFE